MMPRHERADWRNEGRTLADRLDRYLHPENYDHGDPYVWEGDYTVQDIADTVADYRHEHTRRARGAADSIREEEAPAVHPSSVYTLSLVDAKKDRWAIRRDDLTVVTVSINGTEDFLREIDAGATEPEAARRAVSADLARANRTR